MNILLANLTLLIGPILYRVVSGSKKILELIDGFVFIAIGGLVLEHLAPSAVGSNGLYVVLLAVLGFLGPNLLENYLSRSGSKKGKEIHKGALFFALFGFCIHLALDGAALVESKEASLNSAIIIHRLPVGLTIWYLLRPHFGLVFAAFSILTMMVMTCLGYYWFEGHVGQNIYLELIQAAAAGAILHVVVFRFHLDPENANDDCCSHKTKTSEVFSISSNPNIPDIPAESIGNLLALCLLLLVSHQHSDFWSSYIGILEESAFALCMGYLIGALIFALFPNISLSCFTKGGDLSQTTKGIAFGLPLPVCSCGVLPIYESLVKRGVPMTAGFAFLLATPELGIDAFLLSFPLLGYKLTMIRLLAVIVFTFVVTLSVMFLSKTEDKVEKEVKEDKPQKQEFFKNFFSALFTLIENTAAWILLGILFAVLSQNLIDQSFLLSIKGYDVIIFSIIGIFIYVCASGSTPLIAVLVSSGLSIGAGISFLLTGPATNISTFGVLSNLHSRKIAILFSSISAMCAVLIGYVVNYFFSDIQIPTIIEEAHHHESLSLYLYLLIFLMFVTVFKIGARRFFSQVIK